MREGKRHHYDDTWSPKSRKFGEEYELLPCPWCGKVPRLQRYSIMTGELRGKLRYGVWCDNGNEAKCPMIAIETLPFETKQEAVDAWNKRA